MATKKDYGGQDKLRHRSIARGLKNPKSKRANKK